MARSRTRDRDADEPRGAEQGEAEPATPDAERLDALEARVAALEKALDHPNLASMIGRVPPAPPERDEPAESFPHLAQPAKPESQEAN